MHHKSLAEGRWAELSFTEQMANIGSETSRTYRALEAGKEFNGYSEYCLACAGYLGMAVVHLWDKDWPKYKDAPYSFFLISIELMYKFGAAIWLNRLGYKFEKVNLA